MNALLPLTRRRIAGVVLALALVGALSASVASGVERVRKRRPVLDPGLDSEDRSEARLRPGTREPPSGSREVPRGEQGMRSRPEASGVQGVSSFRTGKGRRGDSALQVAPAVARMRGSEPESAESVAGGREERGVREPVLVTTTARIPAPMRVRWTVVEESLDRVRLVAELERRAGFGAPVDVAITVPAGVALVEGSTAFTVLAGAGGDVQTMPCTLTFVTGTRPLEDLVLVARAEGESFGAHAESRYRFGRSVLSSPRPMPSGSVLPPELMLGAEGEVGSPAKGGEDPQP